MSAAVRQVGVTGGAGRLGRGVARILSENGFRVRNIDLAPNPGAAENCLGDLSDAAFAHAALSGLDSLVHLAATPDDDDFLGKLVPNNICAVHHLLEAARAHGIKTLLLASSGQVNWWQNQSGPWPITASDPLTPKSWYAATKMFIESAGYSWRRMTGGDVVTARLGWCPRDPAHAKELEKCPRDHNLYLSAGDFGRFVLAVLRTPPGFGHVITYVTSKPVTMVLFDQENAKTLFGYEPRDQWPGGLWDC